MHLNCILVLNLKRAKRVLLNFNRLNNYMNPQLNNIKLEQN